MDIIIGGLVLGLGIGVIWMFVAWVRMVSQGSAQSRALQSQAATGGIDPALLAPQNTAELRMWEKHYGLAATRGLTPDQRVSEIVQLRLRDGA